jgi:hypothetical protein
MRARDIIDVCTVAARRWPARALSSLRALHTLARCTSPLLTILVTCCALPDLAYAESRMAPQWSWPDEPPTGADCLTRSRLEQRIEEQLGGPLSEADFALSFGARIERTRDGFRLVLVTEQRGQRGQRTFEGSTCREVSDAAVLLIALSLDETRARQGAATGPEPSATRDEAAPAASPEQASQAGVQARQSPRERWDLRAAGLLDVGTLPRATAGFELGLSVSWKSSRFSLTSLGLPPVRSERAPDGSRVEVALWAARLGYCHTLLAVLRAPPADAARTEVSVERSAVPASARLSLGACLGLELGAVLGRGVDLREAKSKSFVWAAGWFAVRAAFALSARWGLSVEPALALATKRGQFVSSDAQGSVNDELFTPALFAKRLSLALELSF